MHLQWIDGQKIETPSSAGADFATAIAAVQGAGRGFADHRKLSLEKRQLFLRNFIDAFDGRQIEAIHMLTTHLGYTPEAAAREMSLARAEAVAFEEKLAGAADTNPVGPCLIAVGWSSPLIKTCRTVLSALGLGNSVVVSAPESAAPIYIFAGQLLAAAGFPTSLFTVISSDDPEALETLCTHPALRAIYFSGHFYESEFLRELPFDYRKKRKFFFGARNPLIFLHDANLETLPQLLEMALQYHVAGEERFNRWFVQEKNYQIFTDEIKKLLTTIPASRFGKSPDAGYAKRFSAQAAQLAKEKGWLETPKGGDSLLPVIAATDFSNCSAWHQQEVLGPVLTVTRFKNTQEAIKFANTTYYSSAAAVFSSTVEKSAEVARQLNMPRLYLNTPPLPEEPLHATFECGFGNEISDAEFFGYPRIIVG